MWLGLSQQATRVTPTTVREVLRGPHTLLGWLTLSGLWPGPPKGPLTAQGCSQLHLFLSLQSVRYQFSVSHSLFPFFLFSAGAHDNTHLASAEQDGDALWDGLGVVPTDSDKWRDEHGHHQKAPRYGALGEFTEKDGTGWHWKAGDRCLCSRSRTQRAIKGKKTGVGSTSFDSF